MQPPYTLSLSHTHTHSLSLSHMYTHTQAFTLSVLLIHGVVAVTICSPVSLDTISSRLSTDFLSDFLSDLFNKIYQLNPINLAPICLALVLVPTMPPCIEMALFAAIAGLDRACRAVKEFPGSSFCGSLAAHCTCFASSCCWAWGFWCMNCSIQLGPLNSIVIVVVARCCGF